MQSTHINPFLHSATTVLEQLCAIRPSRGEITIKNIEFSEDLIWLQIRIFGHMKGDVVFGFPENVALKIVSGMMGGSIVTEFDEMSQSAISELGNMISGNASTMLYNDGIEVDITPPKFIHSADREKVSGKALAIPLRMEGIGEFEICIIAL
jgi:chemotaxis protein CheX